MSDPVTNVEIEDVLSSIRRLVSSDGRPLKTNEPPVQKAKPAEPERLVLTPSLRVDDAGHLPRGTHTTETAQDAKTGSADLGSTRTAREQVEFRHAASDDDWSNEVDAPEDEAENMHSAPSDEFETDLAMAEVDSESEPEAEAEEEPTSQADPLRQRVAELEEVVARQPDQWEPDGPGGDGNSGSPVSPLPWEDYIADDDEADEFWEDEAGFDEAEESVDEAEVAVDEAELAIDEAEEAVEEAIAEAARAIERPSEHPSDHQGERPAAKAALEADEDDFLQNFVAEDRQRSRSADMDDLPGNDFLPGNDEFLDEDALRDLVADIVRQELQGALGERITRNVRKLVRREIHRALTSQDFQ